MAWEMVRGRGGRVGRRRLLTEGMLHTDKYFLYESIFHLINLSISVK